MDSFAFKVPSNEDRITLNQAGISVNDSVNQYFDGSFNFKFQAYYV